MRHMPLSNPQGKKPGSLQIHIQSLHSFWLYKSFNKTVGGTYRIILLPYGWAGSVTTSKCVLWTSKAHITFTKIIIFEWISFVTLPSLKRKYSIRGSRFWAIEGFSQKKKKMQDGKAQGSLWAWLCSVLHCSTNWHHEYLWVGANESRQTLIKRRKINNTWKLNPLYNHRKKKSSSELLPNQFEL